MVVAGCSSQQRITDDINSSKRVVSNRTRSGLIEPNCRSAVTERLLDVDDTEQNPGWSPWMISHVLQLPSFWGVGSIRKACVRAEFNRSWKLPPTLVVILLLKDARCWTQVVVSSSLDASHSGHDSLFDQKF